MDNWEIDEDLLREEKRLEELERIENFFKWYYLIPDTFKSETNYKTNDKYVIELSSIYNSCDLKLTVDRKLYDLVDSYVRTHNEKEEDYIEEYNMVKDAEELENGSEE